MIVLCLGTTASAQTAGLSPQLLLTPQRLKRLKRDRGRETDRWTAFESRIRTASNSPERGWELALYYAVTGDEKARTDAAQWLAAHPCELRQAALIADWTGAAMPAGTKSCPSLQGEARTWTARRDRLFLAIASGADPEKQPGSLALQPHELAGPELYAMAEYLDALRTAERVDARANDARFFRELPTEYLLSMTPKQLAQPAWQDHIAALALVTGDPNSESAQFLQGWGLEDANIVREGNGVAYELLWANPYLPGVSYQNMQPWWYDESGHLLARTDWNENTCWLAVEGQQVRNEGCPSNWRSETHHFGHLVLKPVTERCIHLSPETTDTVTILWFATPHTKLSFHNGTTRETAVTDEAGFWRLPANIVGDVCTAH